jgi:hypothetical protein
LRAIPGPRQLGNRAGNRAFPCAFIRECVSWLNPKKNTSAGVPTSYGSKPGLPKGEDEFWFEAERELQNDDPALNAEEEAPKFTE